MIRIIGIILMLASLVPITVIVLGAERGFLWTICACVVACLAGQVIGTIIGGAAAELLKTVAQWRFQRRMRREWEQVEREMHNARLVAKGREPHERHAR